MQTNKIEFSIDQAIESKDDFIQWFHCIEMAVVRPDILKKLENNFTDEMANNFLGFYNGSLDDERVTLNSGEVLPSLIDDIEAIINHDVKALNKKVILV